MLIKEKKKVKKQYNRGYSMADWVCRPEFYHYLPAVKGIFRCMPGTKTLSPIAYQCKCFESLMVLALNSASAQYVSRSIRSDLERIMKFIVIKAI
jgi:hypothetical protein